MENKPKRVLIAGAATFAWWNLGDEAIFSSMIEDLRSTIPNVQIAIVSANPKGFLEKYEVEEVPALDIKEIIQAAQASNLIIVGGGGLFYDYWGFDTGDLLTSNHQGPGIYVDMACIATLLNKPLMFYAVGVGPLFSHKAKKFSKFIFNQADQISVRDEESKQLLTTLGVPENDIRVTADPAFSDGNDRISLLAQKVDFIDEILSNKPVLSVVLRSWNFEHEITINWEEEISQALDKFIETYGGSIRFIPFHSETEEVYDREIAEKVFSKMKHGERVFMLGSDSTPEEKLKLLQTSDLILGMRLHAIVFAIKYGIPAVSIAYDPKVSNLMKAVGHSDSNLALEDIEANTVFTKLARIYDNKETIEREFNNKYLKLAKAAKENAIIASDLIHEGINKSKSLPCDDNGIIKDLLIEHVHRSYSLENIIQDRNQEITSQNQKIQEYYDKITSQKQEIQSKDARINQLISFSNQQSKTIQDLNAQISLMKSSFSWKITRPTRVIARLIRNRGLSAQDRNTLSVKIQEYYRGKSVPNWLDKFLRKHFQVITPQIEPITPSVPEEHIPIKKVITAEFNQSPEKQITVPYWGVRAPHGERRVAMLTNMLLDWEDGRPRFGGGERYALELATLFQQLGLKPTFFQPSFQGEGEGDYFGFKVKTFPLMTCYGEFHYEISTHFTDITQDYDHVYYHLPEYSSGRIREDGLMTCHGIWFDHKHNTSVVRQPQWFEHLYNAFSNPLAVISVDTHSVSVIRSLWPDLAKHMHYIPNFFNGKNNYPAALKRNPDKLTIIFPRRSQILRGSRIFPEIVANIHHDVDIFWIGEGDPEDTEIIKSVSARDKRVNFLAADFDEMPAWYQRADIVVIPTLGSEGTSLSCLEALASGCATIATNIGGLNDIILNDYNGRIVEPNAQEISQAINFLIENKQERDRLQKIAPESVKFFELHYWREKWAALLSHLGWVEKETYRTWKTANESEQKTKSFTSAGFGEEKWVILTRNAIHGGVESLISQEAHYLKAPVIVCGGHNQPETCPFEYRRADDRRTLRKELQNFDVILYHFIPDWAVEVVAESGKPSIEFIHRTDTSRSDKQVPTGLVTHSAFLSEFLFDEFGRTSRVVDHPIDTDKFAPTEGLGKYIGAVTSYYNTKGIDLFLRAWAVLKDEFPAIPVRFFGAGDDKEKFEKLAKELGVEAEFCSPTPSVWEVLPDYHLFVVPSRIEGFPVAILEALAMNIPVVASDLSGIQEFNAKAVERGYPEFVTTAKSEDVQDLIVVLRKALNQQAFPESHTYIAKYYSPKTHCDNLITAYREFREMGRSKNKSLTM